MVAIITVAWRIEVAKLSSKFQGCVIKNGSSPRALLLLFIVSCYALPQTETSIPPPAPSSADLQGHKRPFLSLPSSWKMFVFRRGEGKGRDGERQGWQMAKFDPLHPIALQPWRNPGKGRDQILQHSGAIVLQARRAKMLNIQQFGLSHLATMQELKTPRVSLCGGHMWH